MLKIAGIVSSYYPKLNELEQNINSYLPWIDHLIIWENTPKSDSYINQLILKLDGNKVEVRTSGQNEYLANPFNKCIQWANEEGYTHALIMDQDSYFTLGHFEEYIKLIQNYPKEKVAVFAPNSDLKEDTSDIIKEVNQVITSGAIFPIAAFLALGGFNEDFVIDLIDTEYCIRAGEQGYKVILMYPIYLEHCLGNRYKHSWTGFVLNPYSAQRTYYIIRNVILIYKIHPHYYPLSEKIDFIKYRIIYRTLKMVFEPSDRLKKLKALYLGLIHGLKGKKGRYDIH